MALRERVIEENPYFSIGPNFEKQIKSFFKEVLSYPLSIEMAILSNRFYGKEINSVSMAELRLSTAEEKIKTLKATAEKTRYKIYIRKMGSKVNLSSVVREFLKAYYPEISEEKIGKATELFAEAYRCYALLFDIQNLRQFFTRLCTEANTLVEWAGLPRAP